MIKNDKKKSTLTWILEWAGEKKSSYLVSIILAILNVIFRMLPYFLIANIIQMLLGSEKNFAVYMNKLLMILASFSLAEIFHTWSTIKSHEATFAVLEGIRKSCCDKLAKLALGLVKDTPSGSYKNIIVERVDSIETTLAHIVPEFTSNMIAPLVMLIYLIALDWRMALISFIPVVLGLLSLSGMFIDYEKNFARTITATKNLNATAVEYINGIEVIKAFGKTESSYKKFKEAAFECADSFISWMRKCISFQSFMFVLMPYSLLTVLPIGALFVANGTLEINNFIMCIILSLGITVPLITMGQYFDDIGKIGVIIGEVTSILELEELSRPEKTRYEVIGNKIELEDVKFSYHQEEVLHGINLEIAPSSINAIVGPSGSGKSTIVKLIASLWDVDSGKIKIGGVDIRDISFEDYNQKIAYVSQDNYLFNKSVRENIRQANPDATDRQVEEIAKKSGCYDFIMNLENGFDTIVGSSGGHLSGGERQRISIARAMLKDAPIVILDEATAYTDPENEALVQKSLAKLVEGKTVIIIAHRLSTIKDVDKIFLVKDGNIVASGKHQELLEKSELYNNMWQAHISSKDEIKEI